MVDSRRFYQTVKALPSCICPKQVLKWGPQKSTLTQKGKIIMENKFELLHVGLNSGSPEKAEETAKLFSFMFNLPVKLGNSSVFAGKYFECMKSPSARGTNGHIAMATENVDAAKAELEAKGYTFVPETASYNEDGSLKNIYLAGEFAGFAIHIIKK